MHLGRQAGIHGVIDILVQNLRHETLAGIVLVDLRRKHGQRADVDAVAILQHVEAVVADGNAHHVADAGPVSGDCAHPGNVVVSPLDVHVVKLHQLVHDDIGPGASVEDVPDDVEPVNGQVLYELAERLDKFIGHVDVNDGADDLVVVDLFILVVVVHVNQLVDGVGELRGHPLSHLGAGVFGRYLLADAHQAVDRDPLPVVVVNAVVLRLRQRPPGVIDEVRQLRLLLVGDDIAEGLPDLLTDDSGRAFQQMNKGLVLPVQIAEKVFRSLGKAQNRFQVDDLAGRGLNIGVLPGHQFQICQISHNVPAPFLYCVSVISIVP